MKALSALQHLATGRVMRQFATKHHLVYFGSVDARQDEHELVRGITASVNHIDNHYTVGTYNGHDIMLVERRNTLTHPGKPSRTYKWLIMTIDLRHGGWPHLFFDALHHDELFYANMQIAHARLQDLTSVVAPAGKMRVFGAVEDIPEVQRLSPALTPLLGNQFDYELNDDQVFVYSKSSAVTVALLSDMLRISLQLAEHLNAQRVQVTSAS